jgi:hypothetical protein
MSEQIRQFMRLYFQGIKDGSYFQPIIKNVFEDIVDPVNDSRVTIFVINMITGFFNDCDELKTDFIFLFNGRFYLIATPCSTYAYLNSFNERDISLKPDSICIDYDEKGEGITSKRIFKPRKEWLEIKLILHIKQAPSGNGHEHLNRALVGLEIPISLTETGRRETDGFFCLRKNDFIVALRKHDKAAVKFWEKQPGEEIFLDPDCVELK